MGNKKEAEIRYFSELTEEGRRHSAGKPFSDDLRGQYLADVGQILTLIPPPPARLLDLGCGAGWTTAMLAASGYEALGTDIAPGAIELARESFGDSGALFEVADFESLPYESEFDIAVFYDSLHHCNDVPAALASVHRALRDDGVLVVAEPGRGHSKQEHSRTMVERHGLTERDMPPAVTVPILKKTGFSSVRLHPRLNIQLGGRMQTGAKEKILRRLLGNYLTDILKAANCALKVRRNGIVTARK